MISLTAIKFHSNYLNVVDLCKVKYDSRVKHGGGSVFTHTSILYVPNGEMLKRGLNTYAKWKKCGTYLKIVGKIKQSVNQSLYMTFQCTCEEFAVMSQEQRRP